LVISSSTLSQYAGGYNVSCNGANDGSIDISVIGGCQPYTFSWSNGATTEDISGLTAGNYTVTVRDANNCSVTRLITLTQPQLLVATASVQSSCTYNDPYCSNSGQGAPLPTIGNILPTTPNPFATCNTNVPFFDIDLTGKPDSIWLSALFSRNGQCCGVANNENCVTFRVKLDPASKGIIINIASGAVPGGSLFWKLGCTGNNSIDSLVCLNGVGPHVVTFCKPGSNANSYRITSVGQIKFPADDTTRIGCARTYRVTGANPSTVNWTSIAPGAVGAYNSYLSCTNCVSPNFTAQPGAPAYIDYRICGTAACTNIQYCDTVRIYILPPLPQVNGYVCCNGGNNASGISSVNGGAGPYTYAWSNGSTTSTTSGLSAGTYTVTVRDANNCSATANIAVGEPPLLVTSVTGTNISCNGLSDGTARVNIQGGNRPYTIQWSNGSTTASISGLAAGTYNVTVTDANGCISTNSITLTQADQLAVSITGKKNVSCTGFSDGEATVGAVGGTTPYSYLWSNGQTTATAIGLAVGSYSATVTDFNGCSGSISVTLVVADSTAPTISCPADISVNNDSGICGAVVNYIPPVGTDNCPGATTVQVAGLSSGSVFPVGTTTNTFTVTDMTGRTATCSFTVTVTDDENPTIVCPSNITQTADRERCDAQVTIPSPQANDNCGVQSITNNYTGTSNASAIYPVGTTTVIYTVTDIYGNSSTCSFTVTVTDNENPTIVCPSNITQTADAERCDAQVTVPSPQTNDNCGVQSITNNYTGTSNASAIYPVGTTTVIYTVTDIYGNSSSCSFTVTITDDENPSISCPSDISVNNDQGICGAVVNFSIPQTDDNCGVQSVIQTAGLPSGSLFPIGTTTNTFVVTDIHGNTATCSFTVTVTDNEGPRIVCPSDITVNNDAGLCSAVVNFNTPSFTDNCDGQFPATVSQLAGLPSGSAFPVGTTLNRFKVEDSFGNSDTCEFSVTVIDNENPTITCPSNIVQTTSSSEIISCDADVEISQPQTNDNCGVQSVTNNYTGIADASGVYPVGTTTVTYTVTDIHGNSSTCSFTVTVTDNENPTIVCPSNITQTADRERCDAQVTVPLPQTDDNCGVQGITNNYTGTADASGVYPVGTTTVTYTVTDIHGNSSTCSFTVTVTDDENPTITCPSNIVQTTSSSEIISCDVDIEIPQPQTNDNCGVQTVTNNYTGTADASGVYPVGTTTVTYTVTDIHGNSSTCSFTVTVTDDENPTIVCPSNITQTADAERCDAQVTLPSPQTDDNCGVQSVSNDYTGTADASGVYPVGTTTVTYTVTDIHGNSSTCSFTVTVTDDENPTIVCPSNITQTADAERCDADVEISQPQTNDNCGVQSVTNNYTGIADASGVYPVGTTTVTYTVTDIHGNSSTCSFTVTVTDNENPTIVCPSNITQTADRERCDAQVTVPLPQTDDNCGVQGITNNYTGTADASGVYPVGTTTVTYTVTDIHGNSSTCSFTVTVTDDEEPVLVCPANIVVNNDSGICGAVVTFSAPFVNDNCQGITQPASVLQTGGLPSGSLFPVGITTNTFVTTDGSGNTTTCSFTVRVIDNENPVFITCPANINVIADSNDCNPVVEWDIPQTTDNCGVSNTVSTHNSGDNFAVGTTTVTYTISDTSGNTATCSFDVTIQPKTLQASYTLSEYSCGYNVTCNGSNDGSIDLYVQGGCLPYSYLWSNNETTEDISGLTAGNYSVTITDNNGTTITQSVTITEPSELEISFQLSLYQGGYNISCNGANDGSIDITVIGGCEPYTYLWNNQSTTEDLGNLIAGTYTVTVTDANGCSMVQSITLTQPDVLSATAQITNVNCNGGNDGAIDITVTGGSSPYIVRWSNNATTEDITGLTEGIYQVFISDANGCTFSATYSVSENDQLLLNVGITNAQCGHNNGSATVSITGGIAPYTILWSNNATSATINNLSPGNYAVTVNDVNGCSGTRSVSVNTINTLTVTSSIIQPSCNGNDGEIDITVSGATGNISYLWSNNFTTEDLINLGAGTYSLTVTSGSCSITTSVVLTASPQINISGTPTNSDCGFNNGSIVVSASGNYNYLWSNGSTSQSLDSLSPGFYAVTVTDANGCSISKDFIISDSNGPAVTAVTQNASCGNNDGFIELFITGGTTPSFLWSHGPTSANVYGLAPADYVVTVTDNNGCQFVGYYVILGSTEITIYADKYEPLCYNNTNGSIEITPIGGSGTYSYLWSTTDTTQNIADIGIGTYSISVTDANGCSATTDIIIEQPDTLIATIEVSQYIGGNGVSCNGASDGSLDLTVQGGTLPYSYIWNTSDTTQDISGLIAGTYSVTVADSNGCIALATAVITQPDSVKNTLTASVYSGGYNVSCNGAEDGSITVIINGGIEPYSYVWSTNDSTSAINEVGAGSYSVTVTDVNGCTATSSVTLTEPDVLNVSAEGSQLPCSGSGNGTITSTVNGGAPDYTYIWSNAQTTQNLSGLSSGNYIVTVTDENGCTASASADVIDVNPLDLSGTLIVNATCIDSKDGFVSANVSGGTQPYSYLWSTGETTNSIDSLDNGNYILTVTDANGCSVVSNYTIAGPVCNLPPVAVRDIASLTCETSIDIYVLNNDSDPDDDNFFVSKVVINPVYGTTFINSDGTITYTPNNDFVGVDSFVYEICDDNISTPFCDTAVVYITVLPCRPNVFIPNGFSPNGDSYNQYWEVIDITLYPNNELQIFNRWGNLVYESAPYHNEWDGLNMSGENLPDGTYFYILKLNDDNNTSYSGYVVINRGK
jgi:gliding motility-associated-like protein